MGRQSISGCGRNDANLRPNTQVLASLTSKTETRLEIIKIASLTRSNTKAAPLYRSALVLFLTPSVVTARLGRCNAMSSAEYRRIYGFTPIRLLVVRT